MKPRNIVVAGTGFEGRSKIIRKHVREGLEISLIRDRQNKYDDNAIAVYLKVPRLFGFLGKQSCQIGFVKAGTAKSLAAKIDAGLKLQGVVDSYYAPAGLDHPRVTIKVFESD